MDDLVFHTIALSKINLVGPKTAKVLISYAGGIVEVFKLSKKELLKIPGIGPKIISNILSENHFEAAEKEVKFMEKNQVKALTYLDPEYPQRCLNYEDAPLLLFYKGNTDLNYGRTVSIVGTRKPTEYGKSSCQKIIEGLKAYSPLIISGLAYGIDSVAHRKSVECNIPTVGVLGHGLDMIYPAANRKLASKMKEHGGLLSEFTSGVGPDREHFPMRNRIIAAMSDVVIVIESARKGGSIITALFANNYNKDVFAIPGRTNDEFSEGCNNLIKQNKAHLLQSVADIAYIMRWEEEVNQAPIQATLLLDLDQEEQMIYDLIKEEKNLHIDALLHTLKLPLSKLSSLLLTMEFKGLIKALPGKQYRLY